MPGLTREMLAALQNAALPLEMKTVECPEWGQDVTVCVRMMTSAEAEVYERRMYSINRIILDALKTLEPLADELPVANQFERQAAETLLIEAPSNHIPLVRETACDSTGALLFTSDDDAWLGAQPAAVIKRLFDVAWQLNGFGPEAVKTAVKNSETSQRNDSGTNSPLGNGVLSAS